MTETIVHIDGMMCDMCQAHVNDVIRRNFAVKSVTASHSRGTAVIVSEEPLDEERLRKAIGDTGYTVTAIDRHQAEEKKGLLARLKKMRPEG